ncbi:MAG: hypothetical protein H7A46_02675 [Verrucomicrobiales bacterium]|nr:hypothetical protein [Verrucomicrobiales bacterium]
MDPNASTPATPRGPGLGRWRPPAFRRLCGLGVLTVCLPGCSVHYGNSAKGIQHVWGVGRTTWNATPLTNDLVAVSSGFRLPGLVFGIGPDFIGINLGYHIRERLQIVPQTALADRGGFLNGHPLPPETPTRWGLGYFHTKAPRDPGIAVFAGRAAAGLTLAAEDGFPVAAAGWHSRLTTLICGRDVFVELLSTNRAWPAFNFPEAGVSAGIANPQPTESLQP